ncbi:glycosyltransferase family 4 protein [Desulfonatronospira sp.]|uniref:glycosyltransferase family 4 protein n=1 Tax=Desulfonatronospira sp. TaxID=1962951 RepID=UPI0025BE126A|nr:glycosyltransferase family 4 protein [Desulfonatronospira sp.]
MLKKLSIAFLLESTVLCGGVKVVFNLAAALSERGHLVRIISNEPFPDWSVNRLNFSANDPFDKSASAGFDLAVATTYRLAQAHFKDTGPGKLLHLVQGFEGDYQECRAFLGDINRAYQLQIPKITISRDLAQRLSGRYPENIFLPVGQGLENDFFYPSRNWEQKVLKDPSALFLVGPFDVSIKQIELGLKAYDLSLRKFPDLKLVRISTVDTRLREEAIVGRISEYHVHIQPKMIGDIFRRNNGLLLAPSSHGEGFGLPALEAMACAVPVVMSDIPSFRSFAQPQDYARFVRHDDPEDMALGICELMADMEKRRYLMQRGLQVSRNYCFKRMAESFEKVVMESSTSQMKIR